MSLSVKKKKSWVWEHFLEKSEKVATCKICDKEITRNKFATTPLINHLLLHKLKDPMKLQNEIDVNEANESPLQANSINIASKKDSQDSQNVSSSSVNRQNHHRNSLITHFFRRQSLEEILAKCAALNGFSIRAIANSEAIKGYVAHKGYEMPKNEKTIWKLIMKFHDTKFEELKVQVLSKLEQDVRFSISLDEWTDIASRRYLMINLHDLKETHNLGLIPIPTGQCDAIVIEKQTSTKLNEIGLNFKQHIVGSTSDGASVMKKYGKSLEKAETQIVVQLCVNHAIHLAVVDCLYVKKKQKNLEVVESDEEEDCYENDDEEEDTLTFEEDIDESEFELELIDEADYKDAVTYVRGLFKYLKKPPLKLSELQKLIKEKKGMELALMLDVRTRWNSIIPMIRRYLEIKTYLKRALELFNDGHMFRSGYDDVLADLVSILDPIEEAVVNLSKHNSNLMIAEAAVKFIHMKLSEIDSEMAKKLDETIIHRYHERRNEKALSLLLFLETGAFPKSSVNFKYSSKKEILKFAVETLGCKYTKEQVTTLSQDEEDQKQTEKRSFQDGIKELTKPLKVSDEMGHLDKDFRMFELTGEKSQRLTKLYNALLSIQPTSTSCEQCFSIAGSFKTKVRNRLSPEKLRVLLWLKKYFKK